MTANACGWTLTLAYIAFLGYTSLGSSYPQPLEGVFVAVGTRLLHFGAYGVLAILLAWRIPPGWRRRAGAGAAAALALGGVLEALQLLTPAREALWLDLGVNTTGALLGGLFFWLTCAAASRRRRVPAGPEA